MKILRIVSFFSILFFASISLADTSSFSEDYAAYKNSPFSSLKWDAEVQEGLKAYHEENYDLAQESLYAAFNKGCQSPIVLFQLALLSENKKSYYSAIEFYQMAKQNFQKANSTHRYANSFLENYGRALYLSGKTQEAIPLLFKAAKKSENYWLLKLVGMISFEQGDSLNAVSYFERAVRVKDENVTNQELIYMYTLLARLFAEKSEFDGATRYYRQVVDLDPTNQEANNFINGVRQHYDNKKFIERLKELGEF